MKSAQISSKKPLGQFRLNPEWISAISNVALVFVGILGTCYLISEVDQLSKQNELVYRSLSQSYRPFAVIDNFHAIENYRKESDSMLMITTGGERPGTFQFQFEPRLRNIGSGVMIYIGYITKFTPQKIDFLKEIFTGGIDSITFDAIDPLGRRKPYISGENVSGIRARSNDLFYEEEYFANAAFLYEDQDGNLFATQLRIGMRLSGAKASGAGELRPNLVGTPVVNESYHQFSDTERETLIRLIRKHDHNMADYITPVS